MPNMNGTFNGCVAGNLSTGSDVVNTTLCCDQLGGKMLSANGSYACAFVQNQFPATLQSIDAWINCTSGYSTSYACELSSPSSNYTGLPSGVSTTSGSVGLGGRSGGGCLMIGVFLLGLMAQAALNT